MKENGALSQSEKRNAVAFYNILSSKKLFILQKVTLARLSYILVAIYLPKKTTNGSFVSHRRWIAVDPQWIVGGSNCYIDACRAVGRQNILEPFK